MTRRVGNEPTFYVALHGKGMRLQELTSQKFSLQKVVHSVHNAQGTFLSFKVRVHIDFYNMKVDKFDYKDICFSYMVCDGATLK